MVFFGNNDIFNNRFNNITISQVSSTYAVRHLIPLNIHTYIHVCFAVYVINPTVYLCFSSVYDVIRLMYRVPPNIFVYIYSSVCARAFSFGVCIYTPEVLVYRNPDTTFLFFLCVRLNSLKVYYSRSDQNRLTQG